MSCFTTSTPTTKEKKLVDHLMKDCKQDASQKKDWANVVGALQSVSGRWNDIEPLFRLIRFPFC